MKNILRFFFRLFPLSLRNKIRGFSIRSKSRKQNKYYNDICEAFRKKAKKEVNVVFFALYDSVWKYDSLYQLMHDDAHFKPVVLVCPVINYGHEHMIIQMDKAFNLFKVKGYNVVKAYDSKKNTYLDVRKEINPDVIFFTNPYKGLVDDRYYITEFLDKLTCYVPYGMNETNDLQLAYNQPLHNLVWKSYLATNSYQLFANKTSYIGGINTVVTGYPGIDELLNKSYIPSNNWKIQDKSIKKIIWAPHHTIEPVRTVFYSNFFSYFEIMLKFAEKYSDRIQIAFKPHPLLRPKLYKCESWGKQKTDDYYSKWKDRPNCQLEESDYIDLFLTSDAMIHDSGSFLTEYLYTKKPVLRTNRDKGARDIINDFAQKCFDLHYHAETNEDIELFIQNVINGIDEKKTERLLFLEQELLPPNNKTASQNIMHDLYQELGLIQSE